MQEFDTLTLHAGFNDHWLWVGSAATMHRDQLCRDTQNALGGYAPHGTYVHLYLNGLYWGLYNIGEKSDDALRRQLPRRREGGIRRARTPTS